MSGRKSRGLEIAQAKESQVSHVEDNFYTVKSQSGNGEYAVFPKVLITDDSQVIGSLASKFSKVPNMSGTSPFQVQFITIRWNDEW